MKKHKTVSSSAIESLDYSAEHQQLVITFTDSTAYKYYGVPAYVYYEFINAASFGGYYNESFKKEDYEFVKVR